MLWKLILPVFNKFAVKENEFRILGIHNSAFPKTKRMTLLLEFLVPNKLPFVWETSF